MEQSSGEYRQDRRESQHQGSSDRWMSTELNYLGMGGEMGSVDSQSSTSSTDPMNPSKSVKTSRGAKTKASKRKSMRADFGVHMGAEGTHGMWAVFLQRPQATSEKDQVLRVVYEWRVQRQSKENAHGDVRWSSGWIQGHGILHGLLSPDRVNGMKGNVGEDRAVTQQAEAPATPKGPVIGLWFTALSVRPRALNEHADGTMTSSGWDMDQLMSVSHRMRRREMRRGEKRGTKVPVMVWFSLLDSSDLPSRGGRVADSCWYTSGELQTLLHECGGMIPGMSSGRTSCLAVQTCHRRMNPVDDRLMDMDDPMVHRCLEKNS